MGLRWWRRLRGVARVGGWAFLLGTLHAPWPDLWDLHGRTWIWGCSAALWLPLGVGYAAGDAGRVWMAAGSGRRPLDVWRRALYPLLGAAASVLPPLALAGAPEPAVHVVVMTVCAYWAGLDLALAAQALLRGEPYGLARPPGPALERERAAAGWIPPWERA